MMSGKISKRIYDEVLKNGIFYGRKYMYWRGPRLIYRCLFSDYRRNPQNYDVEFVAWLPEDLWWNEV